MDSEKKAYWKKRMYDKTRSFIKTLDPFEKEVRDMYQHSVNVDSSKLTPAFQKISEGFTELLRIINGEHEKTKEGVVDLSKL